MNDRPAHHRELPSPHANLAIAGSSGEEGYLLIGLVVALFLIALFLTVAAPTVAKQLERDREVESEHRAQQYVQAIHLYYAKFKTYPTSVDQLLSTSDIHYLRQQYKDPLTGGDYRLIHQGEAKTEVKGFFGEPLQGAPQGGLGSLAGSASTQGGAAGTFGGTSFGAAAGASSSSGTGSSSFGNSFGSGSSSGGSSVTSSASSGTTDSNSGGSSTTNASATLGGTSATSFQGSKGTIVGVGSNKSGPGMVEWNGSSNIQDWEFLYDPRVDLMKAQVSILGGSPGANGTGSFGSLGGNSNALGSNTPSFGTGSSGSSSTGSSFGNSFGSGSSSGSSSSTGSSSFGNSFGSGSSGSNSNSTNSGTSNTTGTTNNQ